METAVLIQTISAARSGDKSAFEALYREFSKSVYSLALKIVNNPADAQDITQEVFMLVHEKLSDLKEPAKFLHWLNSITVNKCTDLFRKKSGGFEELRDFSELEALEEANPLMSPEAALDNAETTKMIFAVIDALPEAQRVCIYCYYYEHMSVVQIADVLEIKVNTVKRRLYLARRKIRKELERLDKQEGLKLYSKSPIAPMLLAEPVSKLSAGVICAGLALSGVLAVGLLVLFAPDDDMVVEYVPPTTTSIPITAPATTITATTTTTSTAITTIPTTTTTTTTTITTTTTTTTTTIPEPPQTPPIIPDFITIRSFDDYWEYEFSTSEIEVLLGDVWLTSEDIEPLRYMSELQCLSLSECRYITDISVLAQLTKLEILLIQGNPITDLTPLFGLENLRYLYLDTDIVAQEHLDELKLALPNLKINVWIGGSTWLNGH